MGVSAPSVAPPIPTERADLSTRVAQDRRRAGWLLGVGAAIGVVGIAICMVCLAVAVPRAHLGALVSARPMIAPGTQTVTLGSGTFSILQQRDGPGPFLPLTPQDVTITGPDGVVIARPMTVTETLTLAGGTYLAVLTFDSESAGTYVVDVRSHESTRVVVVPGFLATAGAIAPWLVMASVGFLVASLGVGAAIAGFLWRAEAAVLGERRGERQAWLERNWTPEPAPLTGEVRPAATAVAPIRQEVAGRVAMAPGGAASPEVPEVRAATPAAAAPATAVATSLPIHSEGPGKSVAGAADAAASAAAEAPVPYVAPRVQPEAAWYADPEGGDRWRWWNGASWTQYCK